MLLVRVCEYIQDVILYAKSLTPTKAIGSLVMIYQDTRRDEDEHTRQNLEPLSQQRSGGLNQLHICLHAAKLIFIFYNIL